MEKINSETGLRMAILQLESKQALEEKILKEQLHMAYESVKPVNLIKSTFKEVTASGDLKDELMNTAIGITAGYLSKVLFEGVTHSPLRKLLGTALMFGVTKMVTQHPEVIKAVGHQVFKSVSHLVNPEEDSKAN